jgi:hypothetical protein
MQVAIRDVFHHILMWKVNLRTWLVQDLVYVTLMTFDSEKNYRQSIVVPPRSLIKTQEIEMPLCQITIGRQVVGFGVFSVYDIIKVCNSFCAIRLGSNCVKVHVWKVENILWSKYVINFFSILMTSNQKTQIRKL